MKRRAYTDCYMPQPVARVVRFIMKAKGFRTQAQFAEWFGVDQSTASRWLNTRRGEPNLGVDVYERLLTTAHKVGLETGNEFDLPDALDPNEQEVAIDGLIGAGAQIIDMDLDAEMRQLARIRVPKSWGSVTAYQVRGDSMAPKYEDGDVLCCGGIAQNIDDLLGKECLVKTADGRLLVKKVFRGNAPNRYHLLSHNPNAEPLFDQELIEARKVDFIKKP